MKNKKIQDQKNKNHKDNNNKRSNITNKDNNHKIEKRIERNTLETKTSKESFIATNAENIDTNNNRIHKKKNKNNKN